MRSLRVTALVWLALYAIAMGGVEAVFLVTRCAPR